MLKVNNLFASYLSLFTSFGTILCCALPSLLVSIGMGAAFAGFIGVLPQVVWLSQNKLLVFAVSGLLIFLSLLTLYLQRNAPCPIDPEQAKACTVARKWSIRISYMSLFFWLTGALFAFILPYFI